MEKKAVRMLIRLDNSEPEIWRSVLVDGAISFYELHFTIQLAMGWGIFHLYEFEVEDYTIAEIRKDDNLAAGNVIDAKEITLEEVLDGGTANFTYIYDFGDCWEHSITLEEVLPFDEDMIYPVCDGGEMACPPEDSGGVPGYKYLQEVLKDKKHPEYIHMCRWVGEEFDPKEFNMEDANADLQEIDEFIEDYENDNERF